MRCTKRAEEAWCRRLVEGRWKATASLSHDCCDQQNLGEQLKSERLKPSLEQREAGMDEVLFRSLMIKVCHC